LGTVEMDRELPRRENIRLIFDELDFQMATQAHLWALPLVSHAQWQLVHRDYLTALELREGDKPPAIGDLGAGMASALTVEQLFDTIAIRIDGPRAAAQSLVIECHFTDSGSTLRLTLSNGALIQTENPRTTATADLTLTLTKAQLLGLLGGHGLAGIEHTGDPAVLGRLLGLLDTPNVAFSIVTP
jgi:alkyl sulfatase BDS1-like metallo-beta-lactamase superfamily hydrolase